MKPVFILFLYTFLSVSAFAQSPQAFNYQGIARDLSGNPLVNRNIALQISIRSGTADGTVVYKEIHNVLTNRLGLFNIGIGNGGSPTGQFSLINWGANDHYIQIEMDGDGGSNFQNLGTSELLSVPYALYAAHGGDNKWIDDSKGIHYNGGNVGIGTNSGSEKLTIMGDDPTLNDRGYLYLNNQSLSNRSLVYMGLSAGNETSKTYLEHIGETYDFEGDKYADFGQLLSTGKGLILRADASDAVIKFLVGGAALSTAERMRITGDGKVGIGTENPTNKLTVTGNDPTGNGRLYILANNTSLSNRSAALIGLSAGDMGTQTFISQNSETYDFDNNRYADFGQVHNTGPGLIISAPNINGVLRFMTSVDNNGSANERMRIAANGNIGIGTETPASKLQITNGDVYIQNVDKGVIMKSPNGNCWRLTMNDNGTIKTTSVSCPN
ncbi:MAG: hypothetical protein IPP15_11030 [Saprospiraceae bacterium]|uniref:Uncharacterized protein n=1 Tax=Candidatus Opimibacter skivensis TaxID=2982028 RepID=A0A9D7STB0_9BACT|nr:hypothetical protein [Candidatus Opimibacter skivensis]